MSPDQLGGTTTSGRRATTAERRAAADARRARRAEVTDVSVVVEAAAAYLVVRPRTMDETRRRLRHLGFRTDLIEQAVTRLVELGYLDDAAYARTWVESRDRARPRGEVALRRELRARGVGDDAIAVALIARKSGPDQHAHDDPTMDQLSGDERAAWRLLERRRTSLEREPDPRRRRQKAYAMLARNGFDPDLCQRVATTFVADRIAV